MIKELVDKWFRSWESEKYKEIPITDDFKHTSPFGTIDGKQAYLALIKENEEKFLGYNFKIHDAIYENDRACVRYTASQGENFSLDVSEWYYIKDNLISKIVSYYHIGDITEDRKLKNLNN